MNTQELRRLLAGATPGPWEWVSDDLEIRASYEDGDEWVLDDVICQWPQPKDAALIVAAVNALPALLGVARALESVANYAHLFSPGHASGEWRSCGYNSCSEARVALDRLNDAD